MKRMKWKWKGLRITTFNALMILISCVLYVCLLMAAAHIARNYEQLVQSTDDHVRLEETSRTVMRASDYLTEQVRMYVQTQNEEYVWKYFEEVTITKSRETALETMRRYSVAVAEEAELALAVADSNTLMERELYAIMLVATARRHTETLNHPLLANVALERSDAKLSPQKKVERAREIVFDAEYQGIKNQIYMHLDVFTQSILSATEMRLGNGLDTLDDAIRTQRILLSLLAILNAMTFLVITLLVVRPLRDCIRSVRSRELFREKGAYEFRYLARVYNAIHERSDALAASEAFLRDMTQRDDLTGLYNRSYFYEIVKERIMESGEDMYIVTVDIANFKIVNEHYGMNAGDRLLKDIGTRLQELSKDERVILARFVVDHYYMCIPKSEFDRMELPRTFKTFLEDIDIRVVYGVFPAEEKDLPVNVMCDRALEAAHDKTYSYAEHIHFYNDSVHQQTLLEQEIESEMEQALAKRQFHIVVQPKYDPANERIVGGEVLVRWQHPQKGNISPGVFIDIFERDGFIVSLDHFVWEEACRLQAQLKQSGIKTVPISINVSRIHFYNSELRWKLRGLIDKYGLQPSDIELEITESICGESGGNVFDMIRELQADGFRVAMDDFGSGYSSLNMLKEMPLDIIKMDLRFLGGEGNKSQVILKALIEMAQTMDLGVVVEGVELLSQVEFLRQFENCYLQGFYYSRPVTPDVFEAMLTQN